MSIFWSYSASSPDKRSQLPSEPHGEVVPCCVFVETGYKDQFIYTQPSLVPLKYLFPKESYNKLHLLKCVHSIYYIYLYIYSMSSLSIRPVDGHLGCFHVTSVCVCVCVCVYNGILAIKNNFQQHGWT